MARPGGVVLHAGLSPRAAGPTLVAGRGRMPPPVTPEVCTVPS
ncbi:hypothetical protein C882_2697 [Caenispirillum salinarum AK4]|uniref:Uncharacterized protein n=1 Tax=Caenispirillum salinarum AK4 TaxID=1238182 RepID=K9HQS3_9PROT|nr:hypothetical protein C882_2697 [Caenispirillum salinarum AK4]